MKDGTYIVGQLVGYTETPWKSNPDNFNRQLGIAETYQGRWGDERRVTAIDVQLDDVQRVKEFAEKNKGKRVSVPVIMNARAKGDRAWLSIFMPKGAAIEAAG